MRLFDLQFGKIILIAPQLDNSFRALQIQIPDISSSEVNKALDTLIENEKIKAFLLKKEISSKIKYCIQHIEAVWQYDGAISIVVFPDMG